MSTLRSLVATTRMLAGDAAKSLNDAEVVRHIGDAAGVAAAEGLARADHDSWGDTIASKAAMTIRAGARA